MIYTIPIVPGVPWLDLRVSLDRNSYLLEFHWNERASSWFFALYDSTDALIVTRKLVLGFPLLWGVVDPRRPPGEIMASDMSGGLAPAGMADLGARVSLRYYDAAELAAIAAGA